MATRRIRATNRYDQGHKKPVEIYVYRELNNTGERFEKNLNQHSDTRWGKKNK